jgi:hypothetical protein
MGKSIKVNSIRINKKNPRFIKDERFDTLCRLVEKYPKFLEKRPIVIDSWENPVILAGNMRYQAIKKLRLKAIPAEWVTTADNFTQEEKDAFMLVDNNPLGQWDYDILANEFDILLLDDIDLFIPNLNVTDDVIDEEGIEELKPSKVSEFQEKEGVQVKLTFTPDDFKTFNENIYRFGKTMEEAILQLLKKSQHE